MLTKRKQKWANKRKPDMIQGLPISPSAPVEMRYHADLSKMITAMCEEVGREIKKLFKSETAQQFFAQDDTISSQANIIMNMLLKKYISMFNEKSKPIARRFVKASDKASSAAVHESMKQLTGGLSLGVRELDAETTEIMKATISENVELIKSIPQKYLSGVKGAVMRSITTGRGLADLAPYLAKHKGITERRATFIARDQTKKANMALSKGRLKAAGVKKWQWIHTFGGDTARELHKELDGKIFDFDSPPIIQKSPSVRGFPSDLPGCRCRLKPVIIFTDD